MSTTPISIAVKSIKCILASESPRPFHHDEPYVVSLAIDLTAGVKGVVKVPSLSVIVTGTWVNVGAGTTGDTIPLPPLPPGVPQEFFDGIPLAWRKHCWGLNGGPSPILFPDDVVILAALMEWDDRLGDVKTMVTGLMAGDLAGIINNKDPNKSDHDNRRDLVGQLKVLFDGAVKTAGVGFPDSDDQLGPSQELQLSQADLDGARTGTVVKSLRFKGGGGDYNVSFELTH
ncbi:hypothetical protein THII_0495 [Thioploca ingrica]|uniref:Uncharacterized protein n=1 Tax=Thioploca ingrica TaxID=40754 RepID=A0A090AHM1_9GAMM|nr:hypothetical protein THII_0495 [Thioploca ingrica]